MDETKEYKHNPVIRTPLTKIQQAYCVKCSNCNSKEHLIIFKKHYGKYVIICSICDISCSDEESIVRAFSKWNEEMKLQHQEFIDGHYMYVVYKPYSHVGDTIVAVTSNSHIARAFVDGTNMTKIKRMNITPFEE